MKKKLDELNRKIRHSRKKCDGMIHKRNTVRKATEDIKSLTATKPTTEVQAEPEWSMRGPSEGLTGVIG